MGYKTPQILTGAKTRLLSPSTRYDAETSYHSPIPIDSWNFRPVPPGTVGQHQRSELLPRTETMFFQTPKSYPKVSDLLLGILVTYVGKLDLTVE